MRVSALHQKRMKGRSVELVETVFQQYLTQKVVTHSYTVHVQSLYALHLVVVTAPSI